MEGGEGRVLGGDERAETKVYCFNKCYPLIKTFQGAGSGLFTTGGSGRKTKKNIKRI